jgi:hypothetical protein
MSKNLTTNFNPRRFQLQPSSPFNFQTPSLFYFLPFSLMPAVCLMLMLPDELDTQIIIHSIKDEPIFHFFNLRNKICGTFRRICDSDEALLHVSLHDLREACKNRKVRSCFERHFREANHPEALCFKGMEKLMMQRNPDQGLKLIGYAVAEDSGAKYFLEMPLQPGQGKNHNLRRRRYLVKQDLDNIVWWYWLDDSDDDDILILLV